MFELFEGEFAVVDILKPKWTKIKTQVLIINLVHIMDSIIVYFLLRLGSEIWINYMLYGEYQKSGYHRDSLFITMMPYYTLDMLY